MGESSRRKRDQGDHRRCRYGSASSGNVCGVPMSGKNLAGEDALFSIVQMPPGIPVATVAIDGGMNAAILAAKILAVSDEELLEKLKDYSKEMKETVQAKAAKLDEIGYQAYLDQK